MFQEYLAVIAQGIPTSLLLTVVALFIAFFLALGLTFLLSIGNKLVKSAVNLFLVLFTGTPLLVQFFLIYAGPGQFQWLVLLKDTALVSLIGVDDLMRQAGYINTNTHEPFTWYGIAALIYLVITLISQAGIRKLELRFTRFERGVE